MRDGDGRCGLTSAFRSGAGAQAVMAVRGRRSMVRDVALRGVS